MKKLLLAVLFIFAFSFAGINNSFANDSEICGVKKTTLVSNTDKYSSSDAFGGYCSSKRSGCRKIFMRKSKCNSKKSSCRKNCANQVNAYFNSLGVLKTEDEKVQEILKAKEASKERMRIRNEDRIKKQDARLKKRRSGYDYKKEACNGTMKRDLQTKKWYCDEQ